jgi:PEP-CTERM motif
MLKFRSTFVPSGLKAMFSVALLASASAQAAMGVETFAQIDDPAVANAPVYGGVSLNNLNVTLVDLDLNDGVAPAITFHAPKFSNQDSIRGGGLYSDGARSFAPDPFFGDGYDWCCHTYPNLVVAQVPASLSGNSPWMPIDTTSATSLDGTSVTIAAPTGLMTATRLTSQDLQRERLIAPGDTFSTSADAYGALGDTSAFQGAPMMEELDSYFEVTPNTKVIFSGTGVALARISAALGGLDPDSAQLYASAYASAGVAKFTPVDMNAPWAEFIPQEYEHWALGASARTTGYPPTTEQEDAKTSDFALNFTNDGSEFKRGVFALYVSSNAAGNGVLSVPEPATYALMGLGLMGIAAARRRPSQA